MEEKQIRVNNTHIKIYPYKKGENESLEKKLSIWIDAEYRYEPIGYMIKDDYLYIPRGYSIIELEKTFNSTAFYIREPDINKKITKTKMTVKPKNRIQEEAIDFLSCQNKFKYALSYPQQALILDTGDGKTYSTIHAIINYKMRALIITHQDKIKNQWIESFKCMTNIDEDKLIDLSGSVNIDKVISGKLEGFVYFVNHQTLTSYLKSHGTYNFRQFFKKLYIGIKVFDEAHLSFKSILQIDMFSNCFKTFYLTATFGRSDIQEERVYKRCFSSVLKFGEETKNYEEKRKHIVYIPVLYRSNPSFTQLQMVNNRYGFSVLNFSKYALHEDIHNTQINVFMKIFKICLNMEGRILITLPKIDDGEELCDYLRLHYNQFQKRISSSSKKNLCGIDICTINSRYSSEDNEYVKEHSEIIISTIKSSGTGSDIKKLRCIINLEPFSSEIVANQLAGRLREYSPDKDTYFFDLIDIAFPSCERQYKTKLRTLKKKCKEISILKI